MDFHRLKGTEKGEQCLSDSIVRNVQVEPIDVPSAAVENDHHLRSATPNVKSSDDGRLLRIFLYGVRCHIMQCFFVKDFSSLYHIAISTSQAAFDSI